MGIKFTIITVCYNSEKTIQDTINSVKNQTYKNYEHIIIDGCSTDNTVNLIYKYQMESDKVIVLSERDNGIYNAMNKGIKLANGDMIVFLNSDDTFERNALEIINNYYEDQVDIIYGNVRWIDEFKKNVFEKKMNLAPDGVKYTKIEVINENYLKKIIYGHNATFVKTEIMKKNLFDERLKICSDYKFFLNMFIQKRKVKYIPYLITNMRMGGISTTQLELGLKEHIKCQIEVLGSSDIDILLRNKQIKRDEFIKNIAYKLLPHKLYIQMRYLKKGWSKLK